jgi:preprotein translocase subunit SecF
MALSEKGSETVRTVAALIALSFIAVVLRVFARLKRRVGLGVDDYLCFLSMFLLLGMLIQLVLCE